MIRRCLILDTETTGLDPAKDQIIETGVIFYSVEHRTSLVSFSTLHYSPTNAAEAINRISPAALDDLETGYPLSLSTILDPLRDDADVIVAHNAEFDRTWFAGAWLAKPWLCTMEQFSWPLGRPGSSLVSLALDHGIGVSSAHRAMTDCMLIAALFDRMHLFGRDLQEMFAHAMRPSALFRALVSFEQKDLAKAAGFHWNDPVKGQWTRRMAIADVEALPFRCARV